MVESTSRPPGSVRAADLDALVEAGSAAGEPVRLRLRGGSMAPGLPAGRAVEVEPVDRVWPGDVIVFRGPWRGSGATGDSAGDDAWIAHRVLGWWPRRRVGFPWFRLDLVTAGDAAAGIDPPVPRAAVVGRLVGAPGLGRRLAALGRFLRLGVARVVLGRPAGRAARRPPSAP